MYTTLLERVNVGGRYLAAFDLATYHEMLAQIRNKKQTYAKEKSAAKHPIQAGRLERLASLAQALLDNMECTQKGTVRFQADEVQRKVGGKSAKKDIPIVMSGVSIKERRDSGMIMYSFMVAYRKEATTEYGYLIPMPRS